MSGCRGMSARNADLMAAHVVLSLAMSANVLLCRGEINASADADAYGAAEGPKQPPVVPGRGV
jgi:hypothetical protein